MQTFKKNLESGGDLEYVYIPTKKKQMSILIFSFQFSALKSTLGSNEVAEVFLSKLRESLKRETISTIENEQKSQEHNNTNTEIRSTSSINTIISPIMNVVSPSPLPSISKNTSPQSLPIVNNKRKSSNPISNPNRFDGTTEEELTKRLLSDILQPNLDIVFVY
jgi:hypothetical protein